MGLRIKKKSTKPCGHVELTIDGEAIVVKPRALRQREREEFTVSSLVWSRELKAWRAGIDDDEDEVGPMPVQPSRSEIADVIVEVEGLVGGDGEELAWANVSPEDRTVFVEMLTDLAVTKIMNVANNGGSLPAGGKDG